MNFKEVDLDILRVLNENNINDNPSLRDLFFNSLIECEFVHPFLKGEIDNLKEEIHSSYKNIYRDQKMVSCELSLKLCDDLVCCMVYEVPRLKSKEEFWECLTENYIEIRNVAKRICVIQYLYNIIKTNPCSFYGLKSALLKGLIINCCKDLSSFEKKQELNKLIIMYAEHVKDLEYYDEIPMIIDDEFFGNISDSMNEEGEIYSIGIWDAVCSFVQKKFKQRNRIMCKHVRNPFS